MMEHAKPAIKKTNFFQAKKSTDNFVNPTMKKANIPLREKSIHTLYFENPTVQKTKLLSREENA